MEDVVAIVGFVVAEDVVIVVGFVVVADVVTVVSFVVVADVVTAVGFAAADVVVCTMVVVTAGFVNCESSSTSSIENNEKCVVVNVIVLVEGLYTPFMSVLEPSGAI